MLTLLLLVPVLVSVAYEAVAHYYYHNGQMKTLSNLIRTWEGRSMLRKAGITALILVLFLHLVLMLF